MFIQVIRGRTSDPDGMDRQRQRWNDELLPGATGFLGSTGGITATGEVVLLARFESEDAAANNSKRPEQGAWWKEMEKTFDGDVVFHDCREVDEFLGGGSNDAGFVQVIEGRGDRARIQELESSMADRLHEERPELIGGIRAWHGDGSFTQATYFTSEREARAGESKQLPDDLAAFEQQWQAAIQSPTFLDLRYLWLTSP